MITEQSTTISECVILKPLIHQDNRGRFTEIYKTSSMPYFKPMQSNCSISKPGVLRGIHRTPYAKLVTCLKGRIYDVCVDLRPDSNTYRKTFAIELNSFDLNALYIPPYCGHGFLALEESIVLYHQDQEYDASLDETYCYKHFDINWPKVPSIISDKDLSICR
jgi:dTDP-4-dehydrorhamnose 3,5-epimerase